MTQEIINPFKQTKKVDWAKKNKERLLEAKKKKDENKSLNIEKSKSEKVVQSQINKIQTSKGNQLLKNKSGNIVRVAKSFKIYPGKIARDFDKRVNKLQVKFDDLDYDKNFVDSGKYMMFLMSFAEQFGLYDLYKTTDNNGKFEINKQEILNHFGNVFR